MKLNPMLRINRSIHHQFVLKQIHHTLVFLILAFPYDVISLHDSMYWQAIPSVQKFFQYNKRTRHLYVATPPQSMCVAFMCKQRCIITCQLNLNYEPCRSLIANQIESFTSFRLANFLLFSWEWYNHRLSNVGKAQLLSLASDAS